MIVDANLLLYAVDSRSPVHEPAAVWLEAVLNGEHPVGIPWQTIGAFVRISTHPRITDNPLTGRQAWEYVEDWLAAGPAWIPPATVQTAAIFGHLCRRVPIAGNLVTDAMLAAIALELDMAVVSADDDFARFPGLAWRNPLEA